MNPPRADRLAECTELARLFLRLGATAFGGPAAHIAMMEDEVVTRRKWMTREQFLDLNSAANLIPGPNSTELAIHIGHMRAGWAGLIVAGACFILPAVVIVTACAWAYVKWGTLPQMEGILWGVKPVILAIIAQALWRLAGSAVKTRLLGALGIASLALLYFGVNELIVLFGAGALTAAIRAGLRARAAITVATPLALISANTAAALSIVTLGPAPFGLWPLFLFFAKVGSVLFGSGYVLLAFLHSDLVERWGWLTEQQLFDAIAVGQFTPGPLFTTATFIGYVLGGFAGAVVATLGIFLPAFFFVAASAPLVPRMRRSPLFGAFLDGVNVASLALMTAVTIQLARPVASDPAAILMGLVALAILLRTNLNSAWLVLAGALIGLARSIFFA